MQPSKPSTAPRSADVHLSSMKHAPGKTVPATAAADAAVSAAAIAVSVPDTGRIPVKEYPKADAVNTVSAFLFARKKQGARRFRDRPVPCIIPHGSGKYNAFVVFLRFFQKSAQGAKKHAGYFTSVREILQLFISAGVNIFFNLTGRVCFCKFIQHCKNIIGMV